MKDNNELNLEIELIKKDIYDIKTNHLRHIEKDMRDVKIEVFRFKYIAYGAIVIFILATTYPYKIRKMVKKCKADVGISIDGDADRIIMCDE